MIVDPTTVWREHEPSVAPWSMAKASPADLEAAFRADPADNGTALLGEDVAHPPLIDGGHDVLVAGGSHDRIAAAPRDPTKANSSDARWTRHAS